jgi:hypothetical protein
MRFKGALRYARREADLKQYRYTYVVPYGDNEAFDLDLHSFSRVLRHPEMVVSCKCSVSNPRRVSTDDREGFIQDEVKRLENRENDFYELLPESFRIGNGGTAEVQTPFGTSLYKKGIERVDSGVFVEIKLLAKEGDARALRRFTKDTAQWTGTKKGHMETMSLLFGMRGFNTFMGKPRTNSILTPITHAMKDLEATGAAVLPVNGGYLQYWADLPDNGLTAELMRKSLNHRIKCMEGMGPEYANLDFEPSVLLIDAKGTGISELRQRFILKSMGRESLEPQVLDKTDFLINFFENVHPAVQERVFSRMSQEGAGLSRADRMHVEALRRVCSLRRTIRDTEDLVWVLRRDDTLPDEIIASKREHEDWLFSFSAEKAGKVVRLLAEEIYNVARRK